jgi:hypothetical protein
MSNRSISFLRAVAATLICLSGVAQIAALWLRDLTGAALADALLGAVYLIIGIGLFGHSRFSLFMAIVIPIWASGMLFFTQPQVEPIYTLRIATDAMVALFSAIVLWQVRNNPSV